MEIIVYLAWTGAAIPMYYVLLNQLYHFVSQVFIAKITYGQLWFELAHTTRGKCSPFENVVYSAWNWVVINRDKLLR